MIQTDLKRPGKPLHWCSYASHRRGREGGALYWRHTRSLGPVPSSKGVAHSLNPAEAWWVNTLTRNPILIPYTSGIKTLDKIYLDTTFATRARPYQVFPSKADGLRELLEKVKHYPPNTVFQFSAWTFGYEEVWIFLSAALHSQVNMLQV